MDLATLEKLAKAHKNLHEMTRAEMIEYIEITEELARRSATSGFHKWFVPGTLYGIDALPKHKAVFDATKIFREVLVLGGNRAGKTSLGAYICAVLATGQYPDWWDGIYFDCPVELWAVGKTGQSTRDTVQRALMGAPGQRGTGMIPSDCIGLVTASKSAPGAIDTVQVKHTSGKWSVIGFKSYKQEAPSFYGTAQHLTWLDEPAPEDIYSECLIRTSKIEGYPDGGRMLHTITPKDGLTRLLADYLSDCELLCGTEQLPNLAVAKALMDQELAKHSEEQIIIASENKDKKRSHRAAISIGWDDVPWLAEHVKEQILASTPPHLRDTVSKGVPGIGMSAVYPIPLEEIIIKPEDMPHPLPHWWKYAYGMDFGAITTAAIFLAMDPDTGIIYVVNEHYVKNQPKEVHATRIKEIAGDWMPGEADPAGNQTSATDGKKLMVEYRRLGLRLYEAKNGVKEGIQQVWSLLAAGKLKFCVNTPNLQNEYLLYRYDDHPVNPQPVKQNDHALDALRYGIMGIRRGVCKPTMKDFVLNAKPPTSSRRYNV